MRSSSLRLWLVCAWPCRPRTPCHLHSAPLSIARSAHRVSPEAIPRRSPSICARDRRSSEQNSRASLLPGSVESSRSRSPPCTGSGRAFVSTPRWSPSAHGQDVHGKATFSSSASAIRRSARADPNRLARRVAATGIRRIDGRVLGDDTYFDTRRDALGWKPSYLGIESRPLSALSVDGLPFTGANGSAAAAARALTEALEGQGIVVEGRPGAGRAAAGCVSHRLRSLATARAHPPADDGGQRQLRRRDGVEGDRGDVRRAGLDGVGSTRGSQGRSPAPAWRSLACGSPTARGSRASTGSPFERSPTSSVRERRIRRSATPWSRRLRRRWSLGNAEGSDSTRARPVAAFAPRPRRRPTAPRRSPGW